MAQVKGVRRRKERSSIQDAYFEWMIHLVCDGKYARGLSWRKLFRLLHETEFIYILEMDANRADDGIDLRYRFAYESHLEAETVETALNDRPCSMLEMMAALSQRCEEHITDDPGNGNRTGKWFFAMIESLGLKAMDDDHFDKIAAADILDRFMRREYRSDGRGGLFTIGAERFESEGIQSFRKAETADGSNQRFEARRPRYDMRAAEIWYQMMWYLNENIYGGGQ